MTETTLQQPVSARQPLLGRRYALELRQQTPWTLQALIIGAALLLGLAICTVILILAGVPAGELLNEFVMQTVFDAQNFKAVLFQASPMIMVGLAGCMAFRARFWNLGLEGQMIWGAIGATAISLFQIGPGFLRLPLMMLAALVCGLLWSLGPILLKLKWQVNEIISTLMLNYIAANFLLHLVYGSWKDPRDNFPYSPAFQSFERLPDLFAGYNLAIVVALLVTGLTLWFIGVSRGGFYLRFVDANPRVAGAVGVPVVKMIVGTVALSARWRAWPGLS